MGDEKKRNYHDFSKQNNLKTEYMIPLEKSYSFTENKIQRKNKT